MPIKCLILLFLFLIYSYASPQYPGWTVYDPTNSGLLDRDIKAITIDDSGNKWIGTLSSGLQKFNGSTWFSFSTSNYGSSTVNTIAIEKGKTVWVGAGWTAASCHEGGLARFDGANWNLYNCVPTNILSIAFDDSGNTWAGSACWGLTKFNGSTCQRYNAYNSHLPDSSPLPSNVVNSIAIDDSGIKWIGTGYGLAKFDGTFWTIYNTSNSALPGNTISKIVIDNGRNKWIGVGGGGLVKFDGINWEAYNTSNSGLPTNNISAISFDSSGNKWIGTSGGGLAKFDGKNWTVYNQSNSGLPDNDVQALAIDSRNGSIWIGTMAKGIAVFNEALSIKSKQNIGRSLLTLSCKYFFAPSRLLATLTYSVPKNGAVSLQICTIDGKVARTLVNSVKKAGNYSEAWNGRNDNGETMAKGIYLYKLTNNNSNIYGKIRYCR
jgi:ligand-binding sensor domain-containing protein